MQASDCPHISQAWVDEQIKKWGEDQFALAVARIDSNKGDFPGATKEMTQAISGAPVTTKPFLEPLLKRLEAKDDINK